LLEDPEFIKNSGAYYKGLTPSGIHYEPISMALKLSFVVIPLCFPNQGLKIQILLFVHSLFIIWYGNVQPHTDRGEYRMWMFNQGMQMVIYYHLLVFSDFVIDPEIKFKMGYSMLASIAIMISVNLAVSFRNQVINL
jgi:hypothetical protein